MEQARAGERERGEGERHIGSSTFDGQVIDNLLGKIVMDKYFDGVALCNTFVIQLTTTFPILAFISDDKIRNPS
jgi:hypothetical protein